MVTEGDGEQASGASLFLRQPPYYFNRNSSAIRVCTAGQSRYLALDNLIV